MRGRKIVAAAISGVVGIALIQGVSASTNNVPVSYDYTGAAEPVSPDYAVIIPTGLVFDANNPNNWIDVTVKMAPAQGNASIIGACKADVEVRSDAGYEVSIAGKDPVPYEMTYNGTVLSGTGDIKIGTLMEGITGGTPSTVLEIEGRARLKGIATKTGNHIDTLVYTVTDVS